MDMDPTAYAEQRYKDGLECANRATQFDRDGHYSAALSFYSEAVEALNQASFMAPFLSPILPRVQEYSRRAEELRLYLSSVRGQGELVRKAPPQGGGGGGGGGGGRGEGFVAECNMADRYVKAVRMCAL